MAFDYYYMDVKDFLMDGLTFTAGRFNLDWEAEDKMYTDNDSSLNDIDVEGVQLKKDFSMGDFRVFGANDGRDFGARAKINFNEKIWLSANAIWSNGKDTEAVLFADKNLLVGGADGQGRIIAAEKAAADGVKRNTYWVSAGFKFTPSVELKSTYAWQKLDDVAPGTEDAPKSWKVILDVKQEALKFTSLWVEYQNYDKGFTLTNQPFDSFNELGMGKALASDDLKVWFVKAAQKWTEKWGTWLRYVKVDTGLNNADVKEWDGAVTYKYSPALFFELAYVNDTFDAVSKEDDHVVRLRTFLKF